MNNNQNIKHTKGPWTYKKGVVSTVNNIQHHTQPKVNGKIVIAKSTGSKGWYIEEPEGEANAKLMASAPELLKALKNLHHAAWNNGCSAILSTELKAARKAINKAEH